MRKISYWAKNHRLTAIISLVVIKLLLAFIAAYLGLSLLGMNIHVPFAVFFIALLVLIISAIVYPSKHITRLTKKQFYVQQKTCDFIIATCSFIMIGTWVNTKLPAPAGLVGVHDHALGRVDVRHQVDLTVVVNVA